MRDYHLANNYINHNVAFDEISEIYKHLCTKIYLSYPELNNDNYQIDNPTNCKPEFTTTLIFLQLNISTRESIINRVYDYIVLNNIIDYNDTINDKCINSICNNINLINFNNTQINYLFNIFNECFYDNYKLNNDNKIDNKINNNISIVR